MFMAPIDLFVENLDVLGRAEDEMTAIDDLELRRNRNDQGSECRD